MAPITGNYVPEENFPEFKKLYEDAVAKGEESFFFNQRPVLVDFAKYVIEYFEHRKEEVFGDE